MVAIDSRNSTHLKTKNDREIIAETNYVKNTK